MLLSACAQSGSGGDDGPAAGFTPGVLDKSQAGTTIQVLSPPWAQVPEKLLAEFTEMTGIKVDMQSLAFDALHDKIVTSGASNIAPADVVELDASWMGQLGAAGWFTPLKGWVPQNVIDDTFAANSFTHDGDQLAIPYVLDIRGTLVDMTMLEQAGITDVPTTWDDLLADATAVKAAGIVEHPIAVPLSASEGAATPWYAMLRASDVQILDDDNKPVFQGEAANAAFAFYEEAYSDGLIDPGAVSMIDTQVSDQLVMTGRSAIVLSASSSTAMRLAATEGPVQDHKFVLSHVPGWQGNTGPTISLAEAIGIPKASKNKEAAAQFLYWRSLPKTFTSVYKLGKYPLLPPNRGALETLIDGGLIAGGKDILTLSDDTEPVFNGGAPTWYPKFSSQVAAQLQAAALGKVTPKEAVRALVHNAEANAG